MPKPHRNLLLTLLVHASVRGPALVELGPNRAGRIRQDIPVMPLANPMLLRVQRDLITARCSG